MRCDDLWRSFVAAATLTAALAVGLIGTARAGATVTFATTGTCPGEVESIKIDGSRFRSDSRMGGSPSSLIYDGVERLMTTLMHDTRKYLLTEVDEDALDYQGDVADSTGNYIGKQLEKVEAQMAAQCKEARKQGMECPMAGMDVQGMMQGMMSSQMPAWRDLDRDGESAGVACRWWERSQGGRKIMEQCGAKFSALTLGDRDRRGLERGMQVMTRYGTSMLGMLRGLTGDAPAPAGPPQDTLVVAQVCFGPDGKESGRATAEFAEGAIPESAFETPSDYSQMKMADGAQ